MRHFLLAAVAAIFITTPVLAQPVPPGFGQPGYENRDERRDDRIDDRRDDRRDHRDDARDDRRDDRRDYRDDVRDDRRDDRRDYRDGNRANGYVGNGYNNGNRGDWSPNYRPGGNYRARYLGPNDQVYRGRDNRYYCRRSDGTTGLIIGGLTGGVLGNVIAPGGSKALGTILGGGLGAVLGSSIDRNKVSCR